MNYLWEGHLINLRVRNVEFTGESYLVDKIILTTLPPAQLMRILI